MMEVTGSTAKGKQKPVTPPVAVHQDFLFVDASKAKSSRQGRRNARSFVMQKARRERPWSTSKHAAKRKSPETTSSVTTGSPDPSVTSNASVISTPSPRLGTTAEYFPIYDTSHSTRVKQEICSDCQIFLCRPGEIFCPRCLLLQPPAPPDDVDNRLFDPFGTASIEINGRESELINHFVTEMAPRGIAVDVRQKSNLMRSDWFGTALNNAGFMHSLLCTAALHLYVMGRGSIDTVFYHKTKAIEAINSAISDPDPTLGISDANIGAVFNLLCVEESLLNPIFNQEDIEGQLNQREIHLNGLRRMLQMRGGLRALNSNRILQAFILWHSTAHAVASFEVPYLFRIDYINTECFPHRPLGYRPIISHHLIQYCRQARLKESLIELVESVLVLIADLNVWFGDFNSVLDPVDIQNYSCVLECLLLNWLRDNDNCTNPLEDALCIALLIFAVRVTEQLQSRTNIHSLHFVASKRLEKALSATSRYEWTYCQDLLLWILAIGAINAEGSPEFDWFVYQTSLACEEFGICTAEDLLGRLHLCGWVSFRLDDAVHGLWKIILNLRLEPTSDAIFDSSVGPLQSQVSEPNLIDWQNIDWVALSNETQMPDGSVGYPMMGDEGSYELGMNQTRSNSLFYMGLPIGAFNDPMRDSYVPDLGNQERSS